MYRRSDSTASGDSRSISQSSRTLSEAPTAEAAEPAHLEPAPSHWLHEASSTETHWKLYSSGARLHQHKEVLTTISAAMPAAVRNRLEDLMISVSLLVNTLPARDKAQARTQDTEHRASAPTFGAQHAVGGGRGGAETANGEDSDKDVCFHGQDEDADADDAADRHSEPSEQHRDLATAGSRRRDLFRRAASAVFMGSKAEACDSTPMSARSGRSFSLSLATPRSDAPTPRPHASVSSQKSMTAQIRSNKAMLQAKTGREASMPLAKGKMRRNIGGYFPSVDPKRDRTGLGGYHSAHL